MSPGALTAENMNKKTTINPLLLLIPCCFDITASTLMNIALTMIPASVYQMLRGFILIITAIMQIIFLKRRLYRQHWTSIAFIFTGVFLVGLAALILSNNTSETKPLGIGLMIIALFFTATMYIVEAKFLS